MSVTEMDGWERSAWQEPGVRLTQEELSEGGIGDTLPSAVPAFIGWSSSSHALTHYIVSRENLPVEAAGWPACLRDCLTHYFDNGGGPCWVFMGRSPKSTKLSEIAAFNRELHELFTDASLALSGYTSLTLVAIPQLTLAIERLQGMSEVEIVKALTGAWLSLLTAFSSRRELFFVLDAPAKPETATACIMNLRQNNLLGGLGQRAALYGPHLVTDYPKTGASDEIAEDGFRVLPPSGAVMGVYARTDAQFGVWKAPANEALTHVVRPQYRETSARNWFDDQASSVNLIRSFAGRGTRVWGCRTLAGNKSGVFRYVQVRRTITWIEANLKEICHFSVFEPNNDITWFQLRGLCRAWLRQLWLEGGLAGADEASAYAIRVGLNESMTATELAQGQLIVDVAVAVLHPAEFIDVKLVLKVGDEQASGTDLVGSPLL